MFVLFRLPRFKKKRKDFIFRTSHEFVAQSVPGTLEPWNAGTPLPKLGHSPRFYRKGVDRLIHGEVGAAQFMAFEGIFSVLSPSEPPFFPEQKVC